MDDFRINNPEPVRAQRIARVVLALVLVGLGLWTLHEFLPALAWAGVLAVAFWPSYQGAPPRWPLGHRNILLPALFTLGSRLVFVLPIVLAGMQVGREVRTVVAWIDSARHNGIPVPEFIKHLPIFANRTRDWWQQNLSDPDAAADFLTRLWNPEYVLAGRQVGIAILHRLVIFGFCLLTRVLPVQGRRRAGRAVASCRRPRVRPRRRADRPANHRLDPRHGERTGSGGPGRGPVAVYASICSPTCRGRHCWARRRRSARSSRSARRCSLASPRCWCWLRVRCRGDRDRGRRGR